MLSFFILSFFPYIQYKTAIKEIHQTWQITHVAFGDLFLEDVRSYRELKMSTTGLQLLFPLWKMDTRYLAHNMINSGLKAKIVCINRKLLSKEFAGREFNEEFLSDLPPYIDPCGENGEFHTFVYGGPMFKNFISLTQGETIERDEFIYTDFLPF